MLCYDISKEFKFVIYIMQVIFLSFAKMSRGYLYVDQCDDLSGRVRGTGSYLVSNPTSPGWWRKGLKGKRLPSIKTEAFSERLAKGFVGTPKLSVLQWEQSQDG